MKNNKGGMPDKSKRRVIFTSQRDDDTSVLKKKRREKCVLVFSDDLITEILIRLPTKSLYRCKCVCKSWKSLISQHHFLNNFIARSKVLLPLLTGVFYGNNTFDEFQTEFFDFGTLQTTTNLVHPLSVDICLSFFKRSDILAVATHSGFVLFAERPEKKARFRCIFSHRYNYIVYNPLTKQCMHLPKPRYIHRYHCTYLFSYNNKGSADQQIQFKVFSLLSIPTQPYEHKVQVYSSETGKWKLSSFFHDEHTRSKFTVMLNGCVYFWGEENLLVYDFMNETTKKVVLPPNASHYGCLAASDGSLCYGDTYSSSFCLWLLVDGVRWDLLHKVEHASFASSLPHIFAPGSPKFTPIGFHPLNHELVILRYRGMRIILYHIGTGKKNSRL